MNHDIKNVKMKNRTYRIFCLFVTGVLSLASCKKESQNVFNMFKDVSVEFHGENPLSVVDYKQVNDGDSVYVDYTITSAKEDMYFIGVEKLAGASNSSPERSITPLTDDTKRRSYRGVLKLKMARDGKTTYRVYAFDRKNVYIGDGYKKVTIDVNTSYIFKHNRKIYYPDVEKTRASFYSILRDETFSYTNGKANSADIDFGIWVALDQNAARLNQPIYNLYSLSHPTNPFPSYDISDWQKRATKFSAVLFSQATVFNYTLVSTSALVTEAKKVNINQTSLVGTTSLNGLVANSMVYFLTPEGKYGCVFVNASTSDYEGKPYLSISVKMQN